MAGRKNGRDINKDSYFYYYNSGNARTSSSIRLVKSRGRKKSGVKKMIDTIKSIILILVLLLCLIGVVMVDNDQYLSIVIK
jgi:hypothetical protein